MTAERTPPSAEPAELVTAAEAFARHRIRPATIRQWVARGRVTARGARGRAHLYDRGELMHLQIAGLRSPHTLPVLPREKLRLTSSLDQQQITTGEAARLYGVAPSTIRSWVARSLITPSGTEGRSHLFRIQDLREAEERRCDRRDGR